MLFSCLLQYGAIMWRLECSVRDLSTRGGGRVIAKAKGRALRITACVLVASVVCRVPYTALIYWRNNLTMEINAVSLLCLSNHFMAMNLLDVGGLHGDGKNNKSLFLLLQIS